MFTSSFYVLFLVFKVSPRAMRSSIPYILNLHLWTMFCDFMFAVMLLPYFMLPVLVIKPYGVLHSMGTPPKLQLWLAFASLGGMTASITTLFEYRHRCIVSNSRFVMRTKTTIFFYNLVLYGYHINFGVPEVLSMPENQAETKTRLLATFPCPPPTFFDSDAYVIQEDGRRLFNIHMYFTCASVSLVCAFFGCHTMWHLLPQNNPLMSSSTRKFQRNFFVSSVVQASIPVTVILIPNVYWNLSITFAFHSQEANNISVLILTLHGFAASIGIIFLYTPYRNFTKNLCAQNRTSIVHFHEQSGEHYYNGIETNNIFSSS
ncbi:unnamed protein product [Caenorhabditis sp. 36 PRJEB53466]|nr:unnamed protein product [Caenorhabditis sp. 36 PRJEB53466]